MSRVENSLVIEFINISNMVYKKSNFGVETIYCWAENKKGDIIIGEIQILASD